MHPTIHEIVLSLDKLTDSIRDGFGDDRTMSEMWGWNFPALNRHDLANFSNNLANKLQEFEIQELDKELDEELKLIPQRIQIFITNTLPKLYNGNGNQSIPMYLLLIDWITSQIQPLFSWKTLNDNKLLPNQLVKKLKSVDAELNLILPQKEVIKNQIKLINDATQTAESLPADLESLKEARQQVSQISKDAIKSFSEIEKALNSATLVSVDIKNKEIEAGKILALCEDTYKITTTKGLSGSFNRKALTLSISMWIWVAGLLLALYFGVNFGSERFKLLSDAMKSNLDAKYIWIQILLSVLSLGAPIWFAWVATKQIGQRFKLSEDYDYKASLAKAYEGYRKEAARIDPDLEFRLFNSALTRLDEAPLRLLDQENYGSPWHEFFSSKQFQEALKNIPELKDKFLSVIKPISKKEIKNIDE